LPADVELTEIGGRNVVDDSLERIARASIVVCQGGFSSLSEVLALGKKALVAPLPGHVEQEFNARVLEEMGAVRVFDGGDLAEAIAEMAGFEPKLEGLDFDGARRVAGHLRERLS
jgi:uncharacterized protein (TIGR00661 family)